MPLTIAKSFYESGRSHALSSDLLYRSALEEGSRREVADPELFAFNGPYSLSINYLLGLGLELMIKAAIIEWSGSFNERSLRAIGHDLNEALDAAERAGFRSNAPNLRALVEAMNEPYKQHWLRYQRPENFELPGDFAQIIETLEVLDQELRDRLWTE